MATTTKKMTVKKFTSSLKKSLELPIDESVVRALIRENLDFLRGFDFIAEILDKDEPYVSAGKEMLEAFKHYKLAQIELTLKSFYEKEPKPVAGIVAEVKEQVFDKQLGYVDEWQTVVGENGKLIKKFTTVIEAEKWAMNRLHSLVPGNRFKATITDNRFATPKVYHLDAFKADKLKTQVFGHDQVVKVLKTSTPTKPKMKAKGDVFRFSKG